MYGLFEDNLLYSIGFSIMALVVAYYVLLFISFIGVLAASLALIVTGKL